MITKTQKRPPHYGFSNYDIQNALILGFTSGMGVSLGLCLIWFLVIL